MSDLDRNKSLLSSQARVQVPWVKVTIGDYTFGKPAKITANTYTGKAGIINIEREVKLSGSSHSKGVLILNGYLGEMFAQDIPLSLTASICFEQLYNGVDGDSASSTELYGLLSSLSEIPINQSIAVTGSVNQKGEIQPIGGVNEKIEGFYKICKMRGLDGSHGVVIPVQNVNNLQLSDEVVDAVNAAVLEYRTNAYRALAGKNFTINTPARSNGYMSMGEGRVSGVAAVNTSAAVWQFIENNGAVNIYNPSTGRYICSPEGLSVIVAVTENQSQAGAYQLEVVTMDSGDDGAIVKITEEGRAIHMAEHGALVRWDEGSSSEWTVALYEESFTVEYVDLGLPSGVKWANCNIGSTTPEGYGGFYAWGELETKSEYTEANYRWSGQSLGDISGNPNYDVARALWGADWRIPTLNDYNELMERCTWEWITSNDVAGYRITGPNGNSIFMPAAGECWSNESLVGRELRYWASTPYSETAYCLNADASTKGMHVGQTYVGLKIRPVFGSSSGTDEEYFSLETADINFGNSASDYTLGVNTNIEWSAESSESWATVVKNDNSTLVVHVEENNAVSSRSASIKFRRSDNGNELGTVNVYQEGSEEYFSLEMTSFLNWIITILSNVFFL